MKSNALNSLKKTANTLNIKLKISSSIPKESLAQHNQNQRTL